METTLTTCRIRAYTSKAGYARIAQVLAECANLYNAALEERREAYRRGLTASDEIPLDQDGLTKTGCQVWQDGQWAWLKKGSVPPETGWLFRRNGPVLRQKIPGLSYNAQQEQLPAVRAEDQFWGEVHTQIARGVLHRLDRAMAAFFRRVKAGGKPGYPRFRARRRYHTIEIGDVNPGMVRNGIVRMKGLPDIRIPSERKLPSSKQIKSLRITKRGRRLQVCLTFEVNKESLGWSTPDGLPPVGLDLGVSSRITFSSGEAVARQESRGAEIKEKQRRMARCQPGSREWKKRRAILSNAQDRARTTNRGAVHEITTDIVKRHSAIAVEDLRIANMTRSAQGTETAPGERVSAKAGLNREIMAQTWGMLLVFLAYKAERAGRRYKAMDPRGTSQTCSSCGVKDPKARRRKRFDCRSCGLSIDADVNAALNILTRTFPELVAILTGGNFPSPVRGPVQVAGGITRKCG